MAGLHSSFVTRHASLLERFLQELVQDLGIRLALRLLHHLTHEVAEKFVFTGTVVRKLPWVCRLDLLDDTKKALLVADLNQPEPSDNGSRGLARAKHFFEDCLGDLAGDLAGIDSPTQDAQLACE